MTITTEEAELQRHQIEEVRLLSLAAERDALKDENARLLKVIAHIGEDHLESLSDAIAMALCRADGNDPYAVVSIKEEGKEPTFHLPYWQHYSSEAAKIARAAPGEKE
jgi:hypothetical protein